MILAAPLVIPFAEAIGLSVATLGIAKASDMVNEYIQENPEQSMKIFQMIMPSQGIANALKNKSSEDVEEVEETEEVSTGSGVEEKIKEILVGEGVDIEEINLGELPKDLQGKVMKGIAKSSSNKQKDMKEASAIIGLSGPARETKKMADEIDDRYEGGLEEVTKTKGYDFRDYIPKGAYKKRYADGGAIGIEVLFEEKKDGGRAGSTIKPKRGLVNEPGGYAGLTAQQQALLGLQLQSDPEFQTGYYKATPELEFDDFYKAPTGPLRYVDKVEGSSSYFDEDLEKYNTGPKGPLRDLDMDRTMGIIDALDIKDPSGELGLNYMEKLETTPDGGLYETMQTNTPKFAELQKIPEDQITKDLTPTNFKNLKSTNKKGVYGYTTLPDMLPSEYGTKFQTENNPVYLNKNLADFITTKPMSPANQLPLYSDEAAQLGFYGAKPADLLNQAVDTIQHEYTHNITKFPEFADVMKNTMDAGIPSGLQLKGKPGDGISKFDKEELFIRALDIERRFNKDKSLNSPNVDIDLNYINSVLGKKYRNLNKDGQSMAIQYINSIQPQVQDYFNIINQRATANRARAANPDVYASADRQGFTDGRGGGFASKSTGTNENFSNKTGRGRTGYDDGGRVGLFMGGDPLTGQALSIYNSMNAYGFDDQAIADALSEQGLYTAPGNGTPDAPDTTPGQTYGLQSGSDNFSPYNPDPNTIQSFKTDPRIAAANEADVRTKQLTSMGINDPFANEASLSGAYYGDMPTDTSNQIGTQSMFAKAKQGLTGLMDNPLVNLISSSTPFGMLKNVAKGIGSKMPVNQRAIQENIMGNLGFAVNDIGQIVSTGDYNDPNNVMAGYNLNRMTVDTFKNRIDKIRNRKIAQTAASKARIAAIEEAQRKFELGEKLKADALLEAQLKKAQQEIDAKGYQDYGQGAASQATQDSYAGSDGSYAGASTQDYGGGEKDGGIIGYRKGGLATMFTRRR